MSDDLRNTIERLAALPAAELPQADAREAVDALLGALEGGTVRAAEPDASGTWRAVSWVKRGILLGFRATVPVDMSPAGDGPFHFYDKAAYTTRAFAAGDGVRVVPGGSTIRRGAYVGRDVVCMPPMFVNVGAWVGEGTLIDSHALVGSCAQVGARVHLSAGAQLGGVLEPVTAAPVVVEDDAFIGGNCGVYEGTIVRSRAVLAAGVILTRGVAVYDLVHERVLRAAAGESLEIPAGAVVVPGARQVSSPWGTAHGLSLQTPIIVKFRDAGTDAGTVLESALR